MRDDRGSGVVEFTWLCLLLLVPLVYLLIGATEVQQAAYGATAASRAAGRAYVLAPDETAAQRQATAAAQVALADQGIDWGSADLTVSCRPDPAACLAPGSLVTVDVTVRQPLPVVGSVLGPAAPTVRVASSHAEPYGSFREPR